MQIQSNTESKSKHFIEELIRKGFMTKIQKGKVNYYKAQHPQVLAQQQTERSLIVKQLIPYLTQLIGKISTSNISIFEGIDNMKQVHEAMFRSKELYSLVYLDEFWKLFGEKHNRHMYELLKRHGGLNHILIPKISKNLEYVNKKYRKGLQETRFLTPIFDIQNNISIIFNDKYIAFTSFKTLSMTVIQDPDIVRAQKQLWLTLWNQSEPFVS